MFLRVYRRESQETRHLVCSICGHGSGHHFWSQGMDRRGDRGAGGHHVVNHQDRGVGSRPETEGANWSGVVTAGTTPGVNGRSEQRQNGDAHSKSYRLRHLGRRINAVFDPSCHGAGYRNQGQPGQSGGHRVGDEPCVPGQSPVFEVMGERPGGTDVGKRRNEPHTAGEKTVRGRQQTPATAITQDRPGPVSKANLTWHSPTVGTGSDRLSGLWDQVPSCQPLR